MSSLMGICQIRSKAVTTEHTTQHNNTMNLSLYSIQAFVTLDSEGNRVLAKYYHPKGRADGESKEFTTLKDQKTFEKGLWQKTKKAGGKSSKSVVSRRSQL